jgi:uncharacterized membrane protein
LALLATVATAVAAYLAWVAWRQHGLPVGCGEDAGCAEVLTSRWSTLLGIPVGALAVPLYMTLLVAALRPGWRAASRVLGFGAIALVGGAIWFLGLQALVLGAFCPWCVAEHILGLAMAPLAWTLADPLGRRGAAVAGVAGIVTLAIVQGVQPARVSTVRLPGTAPAATSGTGATLSLLQGHLQLVPVNEPRLGDATAPHYLYLMFDYCCPHCRRTHEYLLEALQRHPAQLAIICLPMPRDADCNPAIVETEARFEHACELARLALAVWQARPEAFAEYDRWLFAPAQPPDPAAARAKAEELVPAERLAAALEDDQTRQRIERNVRAYNDSQIAYLPVIMSPGMDTIVGRPESRDALLEVLEQEVLGSTP